MTYTNIGTSKDAGRATSKSRQKQPANSSELLIHLHKEFRKDTPQEARERFIKASELPIFQQEQSGDWWSLKHKKLTGQRNPRPPALSTAEKEAEVQRQTEALVEDIRKAELRNIEFNGKNVLDMTREECTAARGLFTVFVDKLKPGQKVREAFSLKQVHDTLNKAMKPSR